MGKMFKMLQPTTQSTSFVSLCLLVQGPGFLVNPTGLHIHGTSSSCPVEIMSAGAGGAALVNGLSTVMST
jgi:hypothetical protein